MPVESRWLDEPPKLPPNEKFIGFALVILLVTLAGIALFSDPGVGPTAAEVATATPAPTEPALQLATATPAPAAAPPAAPAATEASAPAAAPEPTAEPAPTATPEPSATPAEPTAGCPPAIPLPEGARVGWLARARGCADVLYARVNGEGTWVLKPADFPEDLFSQLPEL